MSYLFDKLSVAFVFAAPPILAGWSVVDQDAFNASVIPPCAAVVILFLYGSYMIRFK